jgi:hypothetical protein
MPIEAEKDTTASDSSDAHTNRNGESRDVVYLVLSRVNNDPTNHEQEKTTTTANRTTSGI